MREILFRGLSIETGQWVQGDLRQIEEYAFILDYDFGDDGVSQATKLFNIAYEVYPESVGQFTGLLDKNGKRVFEGDVVAAEVYRHGSGSNWYSDRNINHGKMPLVNLSVVFGPTHGTHGWIFNDLPCTRQQIEELENPIGRERNRQSVQKPYTPHSRCVFEVVGNIHEPRGENDGE